MILGIESYKGDIFLCGKKVPRNELQMQIKRIEQGYDRNCDNFVEMLCRIYGWTKLEECAETADVIYDRDTMLLL